MTGLPTVRVVRGTPDDLELAALVAGLVAATAGGELEPAGTARPAWNDTARTLPAARTVWRPGPDAWRWSGR